MNTVSHRSTSLRGVARFAPAVALLLLSAVSSVSFAAPPFREAEVDAPLPPEEAARTMIVPEGFQVTLFAGEPDVQQPIGFCIDDRGRLWVAEAYNYPNHGTKPGDRIIILEDANGDGRFDKRTVFYDQLNYVTGVEVGFGGAWVMSPPNFYFIPDRDGDDVPDSPPQVLLDGFGNHANAHNLANGFAWGPDGWLYGTHGRTNWSMVGKPGTPDAERVRFDGGVYRYHPVRHVWEAYADGTTNPWGIDWNEVGDAFVCNCVNPHLFQVIQGAHYEPWRNRESSRHAYERIESIADHLHFVGEGNVREGLGSAEEDAAGGGHAHCGTMVYLGDNWPERYRNHVFMNNIHGRRINCDLLQRSGSGYLAAHGPDLMRSRDPWYMGVTLAYGPDGSVFASDWSDTGECHSTRNTRRHTGRIYKISYGRLAVANVDLAKLSDMELVQLQRHPNDWHARHARRLLQERAAAGRDLSVVRRELLAMYDAETSVPRKLRALWTLHATGPVEARSHSFAQAPLVVRNFAEGGAKSGGSSAELKLRTTNLPGGLSDEFLIAQLSHPSEYIRGWAVQLLCEDFDPPAAALRRFEEMARDDASALVRLRLTSALQRLFVVPPSGGRRGNWSDAASPPEDGTTNESTASPRWPIAEALSQHAEDAKDQNLPHMLWYAIEPLVQADRERFVSLAGTAKISLVRRHIARRAASLSGDHSGVVALVKVLNQAKDDQIAEDLLKGILQGLEGRRNVPMPPLWSSAYARLKQSPHESVREQALQLALVFDDPVALSSLRTLAADANQPAPARQRAIQSLVAKKPRDLAPLLLSLVADAAVQSTVLRGLAEYDDPATPAAILNRYASLNSATRQDALQTLSSRPAWGMAMLDAVENKKIPRADLTAYTARQLASLGDKQLAARVQKLWGEMRATPADKARQISSLKRQLTPESLRRADLPAGRGVYQKLCANCHKLFDTGGQIGPEITGAQRMNLDYLLENLIDPSAAVAKDYQMQIVETAAGRVITGLVVAESESAVTIQTVNEKVIVPVSEIENRGVSQVSMMPDGLLQNLPVEQVRNLIAYLASPGQVALPAEAVGSGEPR